MDSEYYQSKYDKIEERIKSVPHKTLNEITDIQDSNFNPKAKVAYKYIELANIGTSGEITGCTEDLGENLPSRSYLEMFLFHQSRALYNHAQSFQKNLTEHYVQLVSMF